MRTGLRLLDGGTVVHTIFTPKNLGISVCTKARMFEVLLKRFFLSRTKAVEAQTAHKKLYLLL